MASTQDASMVEAAPLDGRLARSLRTRRAIVDALRSLHHEGDLRPTAPRVAERAGVSVRTVWQHFTDLETLLVEAGQRDYEIARSFAERLPASRALDERIAAFAGQRARMFEAMAPPWRAARLHEPFSAQIRSNRDRLMRLGRDHVEATFAPELDATAAEDRRTLLDALQSASSWATWEGLRSDLHLDVEAARAVVVRILTALLHGRAGPQLGRGKPSSSE